MLYTLGQAAKACGKTKTTIANAIEKGRLSANKDDRGRYQIDASELDRVYKLDMRKLSNIDSTRPDDDTNFLIKIATLTAKLEAMGELNRQIEAERDNLREQNSRITALLAAPKADPFAAILERLEAIEKEHTPVRETAQPEPPRKSFWQRLVG